MTKPVFSVSPEASISAVIRLMVDKRLSGIPVVDPDRRVLGVLTEGDLLRRSEIGTAEGRRKWWEFLLGAGRTAADYVHTHSRRVADLMSVDPVTVTEATSLTDAVALMQSNRIKRLPVIRHGALVGILSRSDVVRALGDHLAAEAVGADSSDIAIQARLHDALKDEAWFIASCITITVDNAVVTFDGVIYDDRVRGALRVAALNVAGVTNVINNVIWVDPATATVLTEKA
jgi:CBS domain-containing protein